MREYDLALHIGDGPGMGHNMRVYALAQAAVRSGVTVAVTGNAAIELGWPCILAGDPRARVHITDGLPPVDSSLYTDSWVIVDSPDVTDVWGGAGVIIPHDFDIDRADLANGAIIGSNFYPVREEFRDVYTSLGVGVRGLRPLGYRLPERYKGEYRDLAEEKLTVGDMIYFMGSAPLFICPPSVVAYECLALGTPLMLHNEVDESHAPITDALVARGWAKRMDPEPGDPTVVTAGRPKRIDGKGAERILDLVLR
jgi:hypothetical protein